MEKAQLECYLHESQIRERNLLKENEKLKRQILEQTKKTSVVYAVFCSRGEYEDYESWILGNKIFISKDDALEICHRFNIQHDKDFLKTQFVGCTYDEYKAVLQKHLYKKSFSIGKNDEFFNSEFYKQNEKLYDEIEYSHYHEAEVKEFQLVK